MREFPFQQIIPHEAEVVVNNIYSNAVHDGNGPIFKIKSNKTSNQLIYKHTCIFFTKHKTISKTWRRSFSMQLIWMNKHN